MDAWEITAIIFIILTPIAGFLGFYITKKLIEKQLKENPPISEDQIRTMFLAMGRKPSEKQIKQIMYSMQNPPSNKNNDKKKKKK